MGVIYKVEAVLRCSLAQGSHLEDSTRAARLWVNLMDIRCSVRLEFVFEYLGPKAMEVLSRREKRLQLKVSMSLCRVYTSD